jgi:low affinity Fe/Cu permease
MEPASVRTEQVSDKNNPTAAFVGARDHFSGRQFCGSRSLDASPGPRVPAARDFSANEPSDGVDPSQQERREHEFPATGLLHHWLEAFAHWATRWTGSSWAFILAPGATVLWMVLGPRFGCSDTWQLVMNAVSSIVTFLMVFLIQRSQNKDALAMQMKLDELIAASHGPSNRLIAIEELSEEELNALPATGGARSARGQTLPPGITGGSC